MLSLSLLTNSNTLSKMIYLIFEVFRNVDRQKENSLIYTKIFLRYSYYQTHPHPHPHPRDATISLM
jgi:hypothetical protein